MGKILSYLLHSDADQLSGDKVASLKSVFESKLKGRGEHLSLEDFVRIMPNNNVRKRCVQNSFFPLNQSYVLF